MNINGYAAYNKGEAVKNFSYEYTKLKPEEILVRITHCGLCYSDIHLINDDWDMSHYPLIPGHEVVGIIEDVGSTDTTHKKGDRVGIGWQREACFTCNVCKDGYENLCIEQKATAADGYGGFAEYIIVNDSFAFAIPDEINSAEAAPLLCAGGTVYNAISYYALKPGMEVGVVGIGGLGHLAIQFLHKLGCTVTAFSSSQDKEHEALTFGANTFITDINTLSLQRKFDFILTTASGNLDWKTYLAMLAPLGKLCIVGIPESTIDISAFDLIVPQTAICGGSIGSIAVINEMLTFAAKNDIHPQIEVFPISDVNVAITRVKENKARYRVVLSN